MHIVISAVIFLAFIAALVDIITRDSSQVKHMPKFAWGLLVIFLPFIGSVLWFAIGREYNSSPREALTFGDPRRWDRSQPGQQQPSNSDSRSTEEQLADLEREIEEDRRRRSNGGAIEPPLA